MADKQMERLQQDRNIVMANSDSTRSAVEIYFDQLRRTLQEREEAVLYTLRKYTDIKLSTLDLHHQKLQEDHMAIKRAMDSLEMLLQQNNNELDCSLLVNSREIEDKLERHQHSVLSVCDTLSQAKYAAKFLSFSGDQVLCEPLKEAGVLNECQKIPEKNILSMQRVVVSSQEDPYLHVPSKFEDLQTNGPQKEVRIDGRKRTQRALKMSDMLEDEDVEYQIPREFVGSPPEDQVARSLAEGLFMSSDSTKPVKKPNQNGIGPDCQSLESSPPPSRTAPSLPPRRNRGRVPVPPPSQRGAPVLPPRNKSRAGNSSPVLSSNLELDSDDEYVISPALEAPPGSATQGGNDSTEEGGDDFYAVPRPLSQNLDLYDVPRMQENDVDPNATYDVPRDLLSSPMQDLVPLHATLPKRSENGALPKFQQHDGPSHHTMPKKNGTLKLLPQGECVDVPHRSVSPRPKPRRSPSSASCQRDESPSEHPDRSPTISIRYKSSTLKPKHMNHTSASSSKKNRRPSDGSAASSNKEESSSMDESTDASYKEGYINRQYINTMLPVNFTSDSSADNKKPIPTPRQKDKDKRRSNTIVGVLPLPPPQSAPPGSGTSKPVFRWDRETPHSAGIPEHVMTLPPRVGARGFHSVLIKPLTILTNEQLGEQVDGEKVYPCGVCCSPVTDLLVVTDVFNHCIRLVDPITGRAIERIGKEGRSWGQFKEPSAVIMDSNEHIFVAELDNPRVQKFTSRGKYLLKFGQKAFWGKQLHDPYGLALSPDDRLYITDWEKGRIYVYQKDGRHVTTIGKDNPFLKFPAGIVFDKKGQLLVADRGKHCVWVMSPEGKPLGRIGTVGTGEGELQLPHGIAVLQDNTIAVSESGNHRISIFAPWPNGKFIRSFGRKGLLPGMFHYPRHMCVDNKGQLVVADESNQRLQIFKVG